MQEPVDHAAIIEATQRWLERIVIGLNLCPFAGQPWRQGRIRFRVSEASNEQQLAEDLAEELLWLASADPADCENSLLIHPGVLDDFLDYHDFLDIAHRLLEALELDGVLQIASFHPDYRFADSTADHGHDNRQDDPANCSNRSPYPMLHLLREDSIERATAKLANPDSIYQRNIRTLRELGLEGWKALLEGRS